MQTQALFMDIHPVNRRPFAVFIVVVTLGCPFSRLPDSVSRFIALNCIALLFPGRIQWQWLDRFRRGFIGQCGVSNDCKPDPDTVNQTLSAQRQTLKIPATLSVGLQALNWLFQ